MSETDSPFFVDTNILVYAHKTDDSERHKVAKQIVEDCMKNKRELVISNQILGEFCRVMLHKADNPAPKEKVLTMIDVIVHLDSWKKINYTEKTVLETLKRDDSIFIWDAVIAQTMLENGITKIYTENVKDFSRIKGIKAVNPFT